MLPNDMFHTDEPSPIVVARDASYGAAGYRSFEFASFEVYPGDVAALVSIDTAASRDAVLACAGLVHPTSGALAVDSVELARRARRSLRAPSLPRGFAGVGVFTGLFDVDVALTVEQAVARECAYRGDSATDVLDYLSAFGLATHADRMLAVLDPAARARLSAALACAGGVRLATFDLNDPFLDGASLADIREAMALLRAYCAEHGTCAVVATGEPDACDAFTRVYPLDIDAAERLRRSRAPRPAHLKMASTDEGEVDA